MLLGTTVATSTCSYSSSMLMLLGTTVATANTVATTSSSEMT
jgi:hypothetical protein